MTDNIQSSTIVALGGLDSTENHLFLDAYLPGGAVDLVNYEVGLNGGYRRLSGYAEFDADFPEVGVGVASGKVLTVAVYRDIDDSEIVFAARKDSATSTYKFYEYQFGIGWVAVTTGFTHNFSGVSGDVIKIRHHKLTFGNVSYIIFVDGVNPPTIFDGTSWYQLTLAGTGTSLSPGGDQLLEYPKYVTSFENTVFLSGDTDYPAVVCHSAPEDIFNWTAAAGGGQILTGYKVRQIRPFRESLYVFGSMRLKRIYLDSTTFVIKDIANNIGTIAPDSVIEINGDILFLAQDGVRTVSGTEKIGDVNLASLSKQIQKLINIYQDTFNLEYLESVVIRRKSQFRYFISENQLTDSARGLIGCLRTVNGQTGWEFMELLGLQVSCTESDYLNNNEIILHGNYDGKVYVQESGNTFGASNITSIYKTPYLTFGDPNLNKISRLLKTFLLPEGAITLNVSFDYNWGKDSVSDMYSVGGTLDGTSILYDSGVTYDSGAVYDAGIEYPITEIDLVGSFKSVSITYETSSNKPPHTIQGFIFNFSTDGKRGDN